MIKNRGIFILALVFLLAVKSGLAVTFSGYTYNFTGGALNNTNVTIEIWDNDVDHYALEEYSNLSNASGFWQIEVPENNLTNNSQRFAIIAKHFNNESIVDYVNFKFGGLTYTGIEEELNISNIVLYLDEAITVNLNVTRNGQHTNFSYYVGDEIWPLWHVASAPFDTPAPQSAIWLNHVTFYLPANRGHNIRVSEQYGGPPINLNYNNFSDTSTYGNPRRLDLSLNFTYQNLEFTGRVNLSNGTGTGFDELDILLYDIEADGLILVSNPWRYNDSNLDTYNPINGTYNISLWTYPETGAHMLMFMVARRNNTYYGGFRNVTHTWAGGNISGFDFTLYEMKGGLRNITTSGINVTVPHFAVNFVNSSGDLVGVSYPNIVFNYSGLDSQYSWYTSGSASSGTLYVPALSSGTATLTLNGGGEYESIFTELSNLNQSAVNISVDDWGQEDISGSSHTGVQIVSYLSKDDCDVPAPDSSCLLLGTGYQDLADFEEFAGELSGGPTSIRIKKSNVIIHYKNAKMLVAGAPATDFDGLAASSTSGDAIENVWRFGSMGPKVYDEILIGIPYDGDDYNESADFNVTIKKLYNDSWGVIWDADVNSTNTTPSEYADYDPSWFNGSTNCSKTDISEKCFVNTTTNMVWLTIPHFSGIEPTIAGDYTPPPPSINNPSSGGGGSSIRYQCNDRIDNDGDGLIDWPDDTGCSNIYDDTELCPESWICDSWKPYECTTGKQTRECNELNNCGTELYKPVIERICILPDKESEEINEAEQSPELSSQESLSQEAQEAGEVPLTGAAVAEQSIGLSNYYSIGIIIFVFAFLLITEIQRKNHFK